MTRHLVLLAYEAPDWDGASEEVRQSSYCDHEAFSAYVAQHGTEHGSAALAAVDQALAAARLLPAAYSIEIRPTISIE